MWGMLRVFVMQEAYTKNISTWYIIISTLCLEFLTKLHRHLDSRLSEDTIKHLQSLTDTHLELPVLPATIPAASTSLPKVTAWQ